MWNANGVRIRREIPDDKHVFNNVRTMERAMYPWQEQVLKNLNDNNDNTTNDEQTIETDVVHMVVDDVGMMGKRTLSMYVNTFMKNTRGFLLFDDVLKRVINHTRYDNYVFHNPRHMDDYIDVIESVRTLTSCRRIWVLTRGHSVDEATTYSRIPEDWKVWKLDRITKSLVAWRPPSTSSQQL